MLRPTIFKNKKNYVTKREYLTVFFFTNIISFIAGYSGSLVKREL